MNEEFNFEDHLEIFNANFKCNNKKQILSLYKVEKTIENNDIISKKIKRDIYNHPLFLNYNYCLFCLERRKTKYNHQNLNEKHRSANIKTIEAFLKKGKFILKIPENKIDKLSKRRFIHSYESFKTNIVDNVESDSDTELFIENENKDNQSPYTISMLKKLRTMKIKKKIKNKKDLKKSSKQLSPKLDINYLDEEIEQNYSTKRHNKNVSNGELNKISLTRTYHQENIKFKNISKKNIPLYSKTIFNKEKQQEGENIIFNPENKDSNSKKNKQKKSFSFFRLFNYFYNNKENEIPKNNSINEQIEDTEVRSLQFFEKNEKCRICLGEIKDKFTLFCGDFFCRECIIDLLEENIGKITTFNKIECPSCHEPINENTIKFLLKEEYLVKYIKIKTRIDGLSNKNNVPCPHPDCEGYAPKEEEINGTLECQNGHIFCGKCLEEISSKFRLEPKKSHICIKKDSEKFLEENKNIRKCPNCKCWVKRDPGGCNYFRCSNIWCQYDFCWICGGHYEPSHYRNPLSMCFGLVGSNYDGKLVKSIRIRRIRCILISLLFLLILLPIIIIFFSFFLIGSFVMYFQFDGKEIRNIRFHSKCQHKTFYRFYFLFILLISIGLIPFGYICLVLLILSIPIFIIMNKVRKKNSNDF